MEMRTLAENSAVTRSDGGRSTANINYILYIIGFFLPLTALIGVVLAYVNRGATLDIYSKHLTFQIKIFWRGVVLLILTCLTYLLAVGAGAATGGLGFALIIIPLAVGLWWLVWTIVAIAKGMGALARGEEI